MAGRHFPLPFHTGVSGQAGLYPPFGFQIGTSQQAGLHFPFGFRIAALAVKDGAGGRKHVLVYPRYEEERRQLVESLRETQTIAIDGVEVSVELPVIPEAPTFPDDIPIADAELVALIRFDEAQRYQLLVDAIRRDEEFLMEELAILLMLDA